MVGIPGLILRHHISKHQFYCAAHSSCLSPRSRIAAIEAGGPRIPELLAQWRPGIWRELSPPEQVRPWPLLMAPLKESIGEFWLRAQRLISTEKSLAPYRDCLG